MGSRKLAVLGSLVATAFVLAFSVAPRPVEAAGMKATVYLTQAQIPRGLSEKAMLGFARSHNAKLLQETSGELKTRKWKANMVVSFNQPVGDMEFTVLFYDIHDGARRLVNDMSTMVSNRNEKTFVQPISLPRPTFKPNRNMELVVTVRRAEVGRLKFGVVGEEPKRSGTVDFSDEEAGAKKKPAKDD